MKIIKLVILLINIFIGMIYHTDAIAFTKQGDESQSVQKSILVTGASTGIGRHLTEALAKQGHHVYAGARKQSDIDALNALDNVTAVKLDVTIQSQVDAAADFVKQQGTGLYALVNNAGIFIGSSVVNSDIEDYQQLWQVNVEGVYRVTKAFAPLVIESGGRISTTGSIAGTVTNAQMSGYSGSKHWIEAFTDSLADEMKDKNVLVSVIQPGNYQTNIRRSSVLRQHQKLKDKGLTISPEMQQEYDKMAAYELSLKKPDDVVAAYMHALFDDSPLRRYVVTPNQNEQAFTISEKIRKLVELNQWGEYRYSRDELVEMLDKAMASKEQKP